MRKQVKYLTAIALLLTGIGLGMSLSSQAHPPCNAPAPGSDCGYKTVVDAAGNARQVWICE